MLIHLLIGILTRGAICKTYNSFTIFSTFLSNNSTHPSKKAPFFLFSRLILRLSSILYCSKLFLDLPVTQNKFGTIGNQLIGP
jgi:hypothetical protein